MGQQKLRLNFPCGLLSEKSHSLFGTSDALVSEFFCRVQTIKKCPRFPKPAAGLVFKPGQVAGKIMLRHVAGDAARAWMVFPRVRYAGLIESFFV